MKLCFDTVEELRSFVKEDLKAKRTGRGEADDAPAGSAPAPLQPPAGSAPAPLQPPAGGAMSGFPTGGAPAGFAAPGAGAGPAGGGFPAAAAPDPTVAALVQRIVTRVEAAVSSGATKPEDMITWFRGQCGPEAASATWDQIKANFLPKLTTVQLDGIAKMMNA
jgi:hypothetical protein